MVKIIPLKEMVIDPAINRPIPQEGIYIESLDSYWMNRLADGDIKIQEKNKKEVKKDDKL